MYKVSIFSKFVYLTPKITLPLPQSIGEEEGDCGWLRACMFEAEVFTCHPINSVKALTKYDDMN